MMSEDKREVFKDAVEVHHSASRRAFASQLLSTVTAILSAVVSSFSIYHEHPNLWLLLAAAIVLFGIFALGSVLSKHEQSKSAILKASIAAAYLRQLGLTNLNPSRVGGRPT